MGSSTVYNHKGDLLRNDSSNFDSYMDACIALPITFMGADSLGASTVTQ
jgi:hypothetical protein